ncbi:hypothetical protein BKA69DRAFT_1126423 [Paraphysoderma sedebokerense]|nr:hypothetical protein BKA69DRAFT_1126423 [Paraphysoderma sedebokerense]
MKTLKARGTSGFSLDCIPQEILFCVAQQLELVSVDAIDYQQEVLNLCLLSSYYARLFMPRLYFCPVLKTHKSWFSFSRTLVSPKINTFLPYATFIQHLDISKLYNIERNIIEDDISNNIIYRIVNRSPNLQSIAVGNCRLVNDGWISALDQRPTSKSSKMHTGVCTLFLPGCFNLSDDKMTYFHNCNDCAHDNRSRFAFSISTNRLRILLESDIPGWKQKTIYISRNSKIGKLVEQKKSFIGFCSESTWIEDQWIVRTVLKRWLNSNYTYIQRIVAGSDAYRLFRKPPLLLSHLDSEASNYPSPVLHSTYFRRLEDFSENLVYHCRNYSLPITFGFALCSVSYDGLRDFISLPHAGYRKYHGQGSIASNEGHLLMLEMEIIDRRIRFVPGKFLIANVFNVKSLSSVSDVTFNRGKTEWRINRNLRDLENTLFPNLI